MNLDPLRDYLGETIPTLKVGRTLFSYTMPSTVKRGVLLIPPMVGLQIDHEVGKAASGRFQAIIRSEDFVSGRELADRVSEELTLLDVGMNDYVVVYCRPRHAPLYFPRSEGDQIEFSVNFDIRIHPISS